MRKFKIYPEYRLIALIHDEDYTSVDYFMKFHKEIICNEQFSDEYNLIVDYRNFNWNKIDPTDVYNLVEDINNTRQCNAIAACIVSNIGQISYAEIIMNSIDITARYFSCVSDACAFLNVPDSVLDF